MDHNIDAISVAFASICSPSIFGQFGNVRLTMSYRFNVLVDSQNTCTVTGLFSHFTEKVAFL